MRQWDWRLLVLLLLALVVPAASRWAVEHLGVAHSIELLAYDWHCRALPQHPADKRIVIVGMDGASLAHLPLARPMYPLPRTVHAHLVDELRRAGASAIGFDVMFTRPIPAEDGVFAAALKRHGRVVAALEPQVTVREGEERVTFSPAAPALRSFLLPCSILVPRQLGVVRWFFPYLADAHSGKRYLHMAMALNAARQRLVGEQPLVRRSFDLGGIHAPLGSAGEVLVRYGGPPGTFQIVPYHEVYSGAWRRTRGANFFREKMVLVGVISSLEDQQNTPLGQMQGVEILANATQTALQGDWLRAWSWAANYAAMLGLCLLMALAMWRLGLRQALPIVVGEGVLWVVVAHLIFVRAGVWVDTVQPLAALAATFAVAASLEGRHARRVFERFLPADVAAQMLTSNAASVPTTEEVEATVVFCDVRNYTALSEALAPAVIEELLHQYFTAGEELAQRFGTELDKYVGDEIMLYFVDKRGAEPHAVRAVRWALALQQAVARIDASGVAGEIGFRVGVGLCTGPVRRGTVGGKRRIQHTVIGDTVNTASRLQSASKELGRAIVMGDSTRQAAGGRVEAELIGEVSVKGKQEALLVYFPLEVTAEAAGGWRRRKSAL